MINIMGFMPIWSGHRIYSYPHCTPPCGGLLLTAWIGGWLLPYRWWVRRHLHFIGCYLESCDNNILSIHAVTFPHFKITAWIGGWLLPYWWWVRRHLHFIVCYPESWDNNIMSIHAVTFPHFTIILKQSARTFLPTIPPMGSNRESKPFKSQVFESHLMSKSMLGAWKVTVIVSGCSEYGNHDSKCSWGCLIQLRNFCWMK